MVKVVHMSDGAGADPSVKAVSLQATVIAGSKLPLFSARPTVISSQLQSTTAF